MMMEWKSGTVVAAAGGIESALTTTLQPIRDLAKNWDIDIATWYVTRRPTATTTTWHMCQYVILELLVEGINDKSVCFFVFC